MDVRQILKDLTIGAGVSGCEQEIVPIAEKNTEKFTPTLSEMSF